MGRVDLEVLEVGEAGDLTIVDEFSRNRRPCINLSMLIQARKLSFMLPPRQVILFRLHPNKIECVSMHQWHHNNLVKVLNKA